MPFYGSFVHDEVEVLRRLGGDLDVLFIDGKQSKLNYFASPFRFHSRLRAAPYDIVHVHHSFCGFVATTQKRVPVVWTFHEGEISGDAEIARRDRAIKRLAYSKGFKRRVARKVNAVIVVSEHLKEPLGRPDAVTIPAGLNLGLFTPTEPAVARAQLGLDLSKRYVLFASSPERVEKRFDLARSAVELLDEVVGGVEILALDNVPHERVPLYMSAADVLLMTSQFEASPVTVREALACNLAVVTTDVGDVRRVLEGVESCYVVSDKVGDIGDALRQVLLRADRIDGRSAVAEYSLERTSRRILEVYDQLIEQRRSRQH